jgi:anaerobic selenocysteine-containing dehydrogenase
MGTLSKNSASITREWPEATVMINHDDAKAMGIIDGSLVKATCKAGSVELAALVTKNIKKGVVAMAVPAGITAVKIEKPTGGN